MNKQPQQRPVFLNLSKIHMPVMAVISIAHRLTGLLMFLSIPFVVYLMSLSLQSPQGYLDALRYLDLPLVKLLGLVLIWSVAHHLLAGIRYILIDFDWGVDKAMGRLTAKAVLVVAVIVALIYGGSML